MTNCENGFRIGLRCASDDLMAALVFHSKVRPKGKSLITRHSCIGSNDWPPSLILFPKREQYVMSILQLSIDNFFLTLLLYAPACVRQAISYAT